MPNKSCEHPNKREVVAPQKLSFDAMQSYEKMFLMSRDVVVLPENFRALSTTNASARFEGVQPELAFPPNPNHPSPYVYSCPHRE
jgi:hypothetical protein